MQFSGLFLRKILLKINQKEQDQIRNSNRRSSKTKRKNSLFCGKDIK